MRIAPVSCPNSAFVNDEEDPRGVALGGEPDLLRHLVDETEHVADGKVVAGGRRDRLGAAPDPRQLQQEQPREDAGDPNARVVIVLHRRDDAPSGLREACGGTDRCRAVALLLHVQVHHARPAAPCWR